MIYLQHKNKFTNDAEPRKTSKLLYAIRIVCIPLLFNLISFVIFFEVDFFGILNIGYVTKKIKLLLIILTNLQKNGFHVVNKVVFLIYLPDQIQLFYNFHQCDLLYKSYSKYSIPISIKNVIISLDIIILAIVTHSFMQLQI